MHSAIVLLVSFTIPIATGGQNPHPHADTLQKQTVSWLKQKTNPAANRLVPDLGKAVQDKLQQGRDFSLILGPQLTRSGKAVYLATWGDKLFSFELSAKQQTQTGVRPNSTIFMEGVPEREIGRTPDTVKLIDVSLDGGNKRLNPNKELAGWITFTPKGKFEEEVIVRVSCLTGGRKVTQFHHVRGGLPVNDRITFRLKSLNSVSGDPVTGPAILFVDLCSTTEASGGTDHTVRSNALAVLVDVE